jgi:hypothetical protein
MSSATTPECLMTSQTKSTLALLFVITVFLMGGCSDAEEEYAEPDQGDVGGGDGQEPDADDNNGQGPTQEQCDTATDREQCLSMGCAGWVEVSDITNATGESEENCSLYYSQRINICSFSSVPLQGASTASVQFKRTQEGDLVILHGNRSTFEGFTQCDRQGADPTEPMACKCAAFFQ